MLDKIKTFVIEKVLWAEKNLLGKSGAEKKAAVIKEIDDLITLPAYLEWADDIVISWIVDKVCEKLNAMTGHNFTNLTLTEKEEQEIANEIPDKDGAKNND